MRRPYKYPYLTVLILGYYWLEHEGYYYKIRGWLGYKDDEELSYVMPLGPQSLDKLRAIPGRQLLLLTSAHSDPALDSELRKAAKKAKERKQSPVIFSTFNCQEFSTYCQEQAWGEQPQLNYIHSGAVRQTFAGPFLKQKILKFLKQAQQQ